MADGTLADARRMVEDIATNILRLPEVRPSHLPATAVAAVADLIRACDLLIGGLIGYEARDPEVIALLIGVRAHRRLLFLTLADAAPDQAPLLTEAARDAEQASEAKMAAGLLPRFSTDQAFEEQLRARWLDEPDS